MSKRTTLAYLKLSLINDGYKIGKSDKFPLIISLYDEKQLNLEAKHDLDAMFVNYELNISQDIITAFGNINWYETQSNIETFEEL